jgi:hypothetical protein
LASPVGNSTAGFQWVGSLQRFTDIFDLLKGDSKQIAKTSGLEEGVVGKVLGAVEAYATRDDRLSQTI